MSTHYYPDYNSSGVLADHCLSDGVLSGAHFQSVYEQSATQNFPIGTRLQLHDRTFYYAKAGGTTAVAMKAGHNNTAESAYNTAAVEHTAGTKFIEVLDTNSRDAHYFQNGYIWIMGATIYQLLKIKDNAVGDAVSVTLELYDPLPTTVAASTFTCCHRNPYADIVFTNSEFMAMVGVPLIPVTSGNYFWIQTWGPCFGTAQSAIPGALAGDREVYYGTDGALMAGQDVDALVIMRQRAGFILSNTTGGGDQFYQLQIAP